MYTSQAVSKIILAGEHAVVYGHPAIAIPVSSLKAYASVDQSKQFQIILKDLDKVAIKADDVHPFAKLAQATQSLIGQELPAITITLKSDIPIASGLGSGAALATALTRALLNYQHINIPQHELNNLIYQSEESFHGTPSGIDNTVVVYEKPIYYIKGQAPTPINTINNFTFLIADSGISAPTKETVKAVRGLYDRDRQNIEPILNEIGQIANSIRDAIEAGNSKLIGELMTENHQLLRQLTVSSDKLDILVNAATVAGAFGAKLSGGGRGGNIIALVHPENQTTVQQALVDAGAIRVIKTSLN